MGKGREVGLLSHFIAEYGELITTICFTAKEPSPKRRITATSIGGAVALERIAMIADSSFSTPRHGMAPLPSFKLLHQVVDLPKLLHYGYHYILRTCCLLVVDFCLPSFNIIFFCHPDRVT